MAPYPIFLSALKTVIMPIFVLLTESEQFKHISALLVYCSLLPFLGDPSARYTFRIAHAHTCSSMHPPFTGEKRVIGRRATT